MPTASPTRPPQVLKCTARRPRLDAVAEALLAVIREVGTITTLQLAAKFNVSTTTALRRIETLRRGLEAAG